MTMEDHKAIGYCVYAPTRGTFLGKLGKWYTDVRLASVYAEPRAASAAVNRSETSFPAVVVPCTILVTGQHIENAVADVEAQKVKPSEPEKPKNTEAPASRPARTPPKAA
jgi:hypothetical protein